MTSSSRKCPSSNWHFVNALIPMVVQQLRTMCQTCNHRCVHRCATPLELDNVTAVASWFLTAAGLRQLNAVTQHTLRMSLSQHSFRCDLPGRSAFVVLSSTLWSRTLWSRSAPVYDALAAELVDLADQFETALIFHSIQNERDLKLV